MILLLYSSAIPAIMPTTNSALSLRCLPNQATTGIVTNVSSAPESLASKTARYTHSSNFKRRRIVSERIISSRRCHSIPFSTPNVKSVKTMWNESFGDWSKISTRTLKLNTEPIFTPPPMVAGFRQLRNAHRMRTPATLGTSIDFHCMASPFFGISNPTCLV